MSTATTEATVIVPATEYAGKTITLVRGRGYGIQVQIGADGWIERAYKFGRGRHFEGVNYEEKSLRSVGEVVDFFGNWADDPCLFGHLERWSFSGKSADENGLYCYVRERGEPCRLLFEDGRLAVMRYA